MKPHSDSSEHSLRLITGCLCVYRQSSVSRNAVRPSSSGSSSITCVTGSWCGASHTRGTGRWPTSMWTCSARRTPGPRWVTVVSLFSKETHSRVYFIEMKIQKCWLHYVTPQERAKHVSCGTRRVQFPSPFILYVHVWCKSGLVLHGGRALRPVSTPRLISIGGNL